MHDDPVTDKASMVARIERDWQRLQAFIASLDETQLCDVRNPDGWAIKDHLAHLAAWERSMIMLLHHRPPYEGLGIPPEAYFSRDYDAMNAIIFAAHRDEALEDVLDDLRATHEELMVLVNYTPESSLTLPSYNYISEAQGGSDTPVYAFISGNTFGHYEEHLVWMEAQLAPPSDEADEAPSAETDEQG